MNIRRAIAASALLAALLAAGAGSMGAAAAGGSKTYTNKAGYSMHYPASWTLKPKYLGQDVAFYAPDKYAFVTAHAVMGTASAAQIKSQQAKVLKGMGKAQGPLGYDVRSIHGVDYQISELMTKVGNGTTYDVLLLDTVHGSYLYDFEAFMQLGKPSTKVEIKTVQGILNSITLSS